MGMTTDPPKPMSMTERGRVVPDDDGLEELRQFLERARARTNEAPPKERPAPRM
jgi:hypothetical protein